MSDPGLRLTRAPGAEALAAGLSDWVRLLDADPFAAPLVFTPSSGMQRWLSQRLATAGGAEGICAGIEFAPLSRLEEVLSGSDGSGDDWAPERLVWRILELVDAGAPGLGLLTHHLDASDQRYANAARVAALFDRYARLRPSLLSSWSAGVDADATGVDGWQPALWRALHGVITAPDPVDRRRALLAALASGEKGPAAPGVAVFCPRGLTSPDADLLGALATRRRVDVWLLAGPVGSENPLAVRLGGRGAETAALLTERATSVVDLPGPERPRSLLGAMQRDLDRGSAARGSASVDDSLSVHASHGLDRQVEVLREALAGAFADDPTLEPRDVVVACPDPAALAPHVAAAFGGEPGPGRHPARAFRVKVIDGGSAESNQLLGLVRDVAQLTASRATAGQLVGLATHPFVARRFGFAADDAERLSDLIAQASVRWGLDDAHRRDYGLGLVRQGTWQVGVQRLLLGEALSDDELPSAGVIAPVDDVDSSDIELVGALAELVSRVWRLAAGPQTPTASGWIAHLRRIADQLTDVPFESGWQQAELWAVLDLLGRRSGDSAAELGAADALALLDAEFGRRHARRSFGDGSLIVCGLGALAQVPHRLVCLVGLDERSFPRRGIADGDDLLAASPRPGDPDPGRDDRQLVLDALGAARERLVVIYQGWSSHTREVRPAPLGVVELIEAAAATAGVAPSALVVDEPLQPFSPALFGGAARSFDATALRAARALVAPGRVAARDRYATAGISRAEPVASLDLDQVRAFLHHPAKYFLRERAQLTLGDDDPPTEVLPVELDALDRWAIGDRILARLRQGHSPAAAQHAEWLRGDLPPGRLGQRALEGVAATAVRVAGDATMFDDAAAAHHVVDLSIDGVRLTGRGSTRGDVSVATHFSRPSARHLATSWLETLALTVSLERPVDSLIFGGGRRVRLTAPDPDRARALLGEVVALAAEGRDRVLPLPPRVAKLWAECRVRNADPLADRSLRRTWEWDLDETWRAVLPRGAKPWAEPADGSPWAQRGERSLLGSLAEVVWRPIVRAES